MRILLAFLLAVTSALAYAEKHIIVMKPILGAKDAKGEQKPLGVTFTPSTRAAAVATKRATAIKAGTKIEIANALEATEEEILKVAQPAIEYHMIVPDDFDHVAAGAVYAAKWDGKAPYIKVLVGDQHAITHAFAGWPMVRKIEWQAAQPKETIK